MPGSGWIEHFHFMRPLWGLLLVLPLLALALQLRTRAGQDQLEGIIAPHLLKALRLRQFRNRLFSPIAVAWMLMLLMTVVVMGPSWRQQPSPLARDDAALVVLLDASASMKQADIQPSRLVRARQKLSELFALREDARNALVVYAGSAHTVLGLTDDSDILNQYLSAIDTRVMPRNGKFAERALPLVDTVIGDGTAPTTVLLVTDGVSEGSEATFEEFFGARPHQLLVWGVGTEDAEIPLETRALENLASSAGGRFIPLSVDKRDVTATHRRIEAHYVVTGDSAVPWQDAGYWLVFPCLALFALWFRRGWTLQWGLAALLVLGNPEPAMAESHTGQEGFTRWFTGLWLTPDQQGQRLLQRGEYTAAADRFESPHWKAVAYYYAEEFELAAEYFSRVDSPAARFNRANALAQGERYLDAVAQYTEVLAEAPDFEAARRNRQLVQDLIDAINAMSESQRDGKPGEQAGEEEAARADGADETLMAEMQREQLSAEQILQDEKINDMWMRSVQRDPTYFLAVKFSMQLDQQRQEEPDP